ncbi:hypothetical protein GBAR_LOCUS18758 [Geodia barretti]|uniref:Uncharacterized protein n=1 Tax=Geodia barretti TaxID=519541 RepID=A0AA35SNT1_GEOBA|nr:hypothetical protein GBAR_LOCUS18758 [Geodia barretti]
MEFREYQSLSDPACKSLDGFWASVGDLPKPAGEIADPERLFSMIVCNILSAKINHDQECK